VRYRDEVTEQLSARVDDRLLGATEFADGAAVRIVRADALSETERLEAVDLLAATSSGWAAFEVPVVATEHLRWRLESPYGEHPGYVIVQHHDGLLTNMEWATFRPFLLHGRGVVGAGPREAAGPTSLDASERAQLANLHDLVDAQFDAQIGFHPDASDAHSELTSGRAFELGNRVLARTRVLDGHRLALERAERGTMGLPAALIEASLLWPRAIAAVAERTAVVASDVRIERVRRFDERIDEFFVQAARPFELIGVRDAPYLNWRYCDERAGAFLPLVAFEDDAIAGYAVVRLISDRAYLADLLALPDRQDVVASLLRRASEVARRQSAMTIESWLPSTHPYAETYKRLGFFDSRSGPVLTVNDRGRGGRGALDFLRAPSASVHVALGDSDSI